MLDDDDSSWPMFPRRKFIANTSKIIFASQIFTTVSFAGNQPFVLNSDDFYLIGGLTVDRKSRLPELINKSSLQDHFLIAINEKTGASLRVAVPYPPHSILVHPTKKGTVIGVPNDGMLSEAVEVDLIAAKVTKKIKSKAERGFYGHGIVLSDKSVIMLVEYESDTTTSVSVRDCNSYRELARMNDFAASPHAISCLSETSSDYILVCFPDYLAVISSSSGKIVRKYFANDPSQRLAHIENGLEGETIVLASVSSAFDRKSNSGKIFRTKSSSDSLLEIPYPKLLPGEALSSAIDLNSQVMAVTHQDCDTLTLWDLKTYTCISTATLSPRPRGVTFDAKSGLFSVSTIDSKIYKVRGNGQMTQALDYAPNSSHFIRTQLKV